MEKLNKLSSSVLASLDNARQLNYFLNFSSEKKAREKRRSHNSCAMASGENSRLILFMKIGKK